MKEKNRIIFRFIAVYLVLMSAALVLIGYEPIKNIFDLNGYFTFSLLKITGRLFALFNIPVSIDGSIIHLQGFSMNVLFGCNGLEAFLIYTVGIIAFPAKIKAKIIGLLSGFLVLQILNVVRIVGLGFAGIYMREYFDFIHIYLAQSVMIVFAVVIFIGWLNYATKK